MVFTYGEYNAVYVNKTQMTFPYILGLFLCNTHTNTHTHTL